MKKGYIYFVLIIGLAYSCSGGGDGGEPEEKEQPISNTAPTVPVQVYPLNNTLCIDNNIAFQWEASSDVDNDRITYSVEISEDNNFSTLTATRTSSSNTSIITLEKGKSFYWRVKAMDNRDEDSSFSSVSQFLTEGDGISNHLPFVAELLAPKIDAVIAKTSVTLSWTANDFDNDALTFDVYLDTASNPVTKVSDNQTETTFNVTNLAPATSYYFKVDVKDEHGGVTLGQIWSFKTQ